MRVAFDYPFFSNFMAPTRIQGLKRMRCEEFFLSIRQRLQITSARIWKFRGSCTFPRDTLPKPRRQGFSSRITQNGTYFTKARRKFFTSRFKQN